jgi:glycosyltransferase involved in cell wall biosynthesis
MILLNIDYLVDININGNSGKEKGSGEKALRLKEKGKRVRIFSIKNTKARSFSRFASMLWLELKYLLYGIVKNYKPDVIFTRSTLAFGTWAYGKIYNVPVIREVHSDFWDEIKILYQSKQLHLKLLYLIHKYNLFFVKRSNGIIFNNTRLQQHFVDTYNIPAERTTTIPNGCDTTRFYPMDKTAARKQLSLDYNTTYLLFIGSVSKWHGVEHLLKAQQLINEKRKDVVLLVIGGHDLSEAEELKKKYANEYTAFIGKVPYEKALLYINAVDVCLIPVNDIRISPGSPIKLYDAISCGKPVITQENTPGYSDITKQFDLGISCNFTDSKEAAEAVMAFVASVDSEYYKIHNRTIALKHLEWNVKIERWIDFAKDMIGLNEI